MRFLCSHGLLTRAVQRQFVRIPIEEVGEPFITPPPATVSVIATEPSAPTNVPTVHSSVEVSPTEALSALKSHLAPKPNDPVPPSQATLPIEVPSNSVEFELAWRETHGAVELQAQLLQVSALPWRPC